MDSLSRREFIQTAFALGATAVVAGATGKPSTTTRLDRRDLFLECVASAEPTSVSVILWTRYASSATTSLIVEVATDPAFKNVVATSNTTATTTSDWTCRVLVGGLQPAHEYWYRFTDPHGRGSRDGRTLTAPAETTLAR